MEIRSREEEETCECGAGTEEEDCSDPPLDMEPSAVTSNVRDCRCTGPSGSVVDASASPLLSPSTMVGEEAPGLLPTVSYDTRALEYRRGRVYTLERRLSSSNAS